VGVLEYAAELMAREERGAVFNDGCNAQKHLEIEELALWCRVGRREENARLLKMARFVERQEKGRDGKVEVTRKKSISRLCCQIERWKKTIGGVY
jgi:hypothetical protein